MITTSLTILINGGLTSPGIKVSLMQNGRHISDFSTTKNLAHPFNDLAPGNYDLLITGANTRGASTTFTLTRTNITLHPPDDSPITKAEANYKVTFHFTVVAPS